MRVVPAGHGTGAVDGSGQVYPFGHCLQTVSPVAASEGNRAASVSSYGRSNAVVFRSYLL